jgi:hypothetical protein
MSIMRSWLGSQHEHLAQDGLWLLLRGPIDPYSSSIATGRLDYNAALQDSKGCIDWVPRFFDLGWFHGCGYGSSLADLHHPSEALLEVSQSDNWQEERDHQHESWWGSWEVHLPPQEPCMLLSDLSPSIPGLKKGRCVEVLPEHMRSHSQSQNRRSQNAMTPDKKPSAAKNFLLKFFRCIKNATSATISSPVVPAT